jgi:predicted nucleic acid-binding protein
MMTLVLDASAILRFTDQEPGHNRVRDLLQQARKGQVELLISAVNWSEIVAALHKRAGAKNLVTAPTTLAANLAALPISIVPVGQPEAEAAAAFRYDYTVPFADAFAGALTLACAGASAGVQATLVTADYDFKSVPPGTMNIEFLPVK